MSANEHVIISVDQGTSSTKAIMVARDGAIIRRVVRPVGRHDPAPGWVEQSATEIRDSVIEALDEIMRDCDVAVRGVGISNQRESALIWERESGAPLGPMLGWQDRRTAHRVAELASEGWDERIRKSTGLMLDPMFSALKLEWLLDQVDPDRSRSEQGEILFGTVDSWLVFNLTGEHRIEIGNASRTQLLNLRSGDWDDEILDLLRIPRSIMPRVARSDEHTRPITTVPALGEDTRITGVLGDSHAALYAHGVRDPGQVKATYGSGSSIMGLDSSAGEGSEGLVRTIAWAAPEPAFAFEGTIVATGATVLWLANLLGMDPEQLSELAQRSDGPHPVDLVPAFGGLSAPWWDEHAVALISGLGLGTRTEHLARAAFESIVHQTEDLFSAVERQLELKIDTVLADGGPTRNAWLMQMQADYGQRLVLQSEVAELSATGAAHMAGVSCGLWSETECLSLERPRREFAPRMPAETAGPLRDRWVDAIARSRFRPEGRQASPNSVGSKE